MSNITSRQGFEFCNGVHDPDAYDRWTTVNSDLSNYLYNAIFASMPISVEEILETRVASLEGAGIDLAGGNDGIALQDVLRQGIITNGLLTSMDDLRGRVRPERIALITGNLATRGTWQEIEAWRRVNAPLGFSLALHRPVGAMQRLPVSYYEGATHAVVDMLQPGGVFYTQVPNRLSALPIELKRICADLNSRDDVESAHISTTGLKALILESYE